MHPNHDPSRDLGPNTPPPDGGAGQGARPLDLGHQLPPEPVRLDFVPTPLASLTGNPGAMRRELEARMNARHPTNMLAIGDLRVPMVANEDGEPSFSRRPIYGVRDLPDGIPGNPAWDCQVLVNAVGGPAWVNQHREDVTLDPVLAPFQPIGTHDGRFGFAVVNPNPGMANQDQGFLLTLIVKGDDPSPGQFWYREREDALAAMVSLTEDEPDFLKHQHLRNALDSGIERLWDDRTPDGLADFLLHAHSHRGLGQIKHFDWVSTPKEVLNFLFGVGLGLEDQEWAAVGGPNAYLAKTIDTVNHRLPEKMSLFYDWSADYGEKPGIYLKDERRPGPILPFEEGTVKVALVHGGNAVKIDTPDGRSTLLNGLDAIRNTQLSLPFDHIEDFRAGWPVVIQDPGFSFD